MEPKAHHVLIGLFVVVSVGAALLFALWLSNSDNDREYTRYVVYFNQAVSGLAEGNSVLYNGIKVGDVVKLGLDPHDLRKVRAEIRVYQGIPVKEDTTASLTLVNITGSMSIQLSGGTPQSPRLYSEVENPEIIYAEPSSLSSLLANGEDMVKQVGLLLANANALFSRENVDRLGKVLNNFEILSAKLSGQSGNIAEVLHSIERAANQAEKTFADFATVGAAAQAMIEKDGDAAFSAARQSMESLNAIMLELQGVLNTNKSSLTQGFKGIGELDPIMRNLRATMENLNQITRHIEDNPAEFILGRGSVQEFSP